MCVGVKRHVASGREISRLQHGLELIMARYTRIINCRPCCNLYIRNRCTLLSLHFSLFSERERSLYAVVRPSSYAVCLSSVTLVHRPYSAGWNFRQCFHAIWYLGHPLISWKILRRSSKGTLRSGSLNAGGVATYSDFGPIEGYILETVQGNY